jgi:hypothetical protein
MGVDTGHDGSSPRARGTESRLPTVQPTGNRSRKRLCSRGSPARPPGRYLEAVRRIVKQRNLICGRNHSTNNESASLRRSGGTRGRKIMARARVNYTLPAKNFRTLVYWAHGGVCSMTGKAYCRPEERKLVMDWARELGLLPPFSPEESNKVVRAPRPVPQIEATSKLASDPTPDEIRRGELVIHGTKTI